MTPPFIALGNFKIAPFKTHKVKPYGSFINNTAAWEYPIKQDVKLAHESLHFNWPSAAHAFHAQKFILLLRKFPETKTLQIALIQSLRQLESTKNKTHDEFYDQHDFIPILEKLLNDYPALGKNIHPLSVPYRVKFMRDVLTLKLEQHPNLKKLALDSAQEGIIPVFVDHKDAFFSSGPEGLGRNLLGIMIYALGNQYLRAQDQQGLILRVWESYSYLRTHSPQALSYQHLLPFTHVNTQGWTINLSPAVEADKEKLTRKIQQELVSKGCILVRTVAKDMHNPHRIVTQLVFQSADNAKIFRHAYCVDTSQMSSDSKTISINIEQLNDFLDLMGVKLPSSLPFTSWQAGLMDEHQRHTHHHETRLFKPAKVRDTVNEIIKLLTLSPLESDSLFQSALVNYLNKLREQMCTDAKLHDSSWILQKIKQFSDSYASTVSYDKSIFYQQMHQALHDPLVKNIGDLRNKVTLALSRDQGTANDLRSKIRE